MVVLSQVMDEVEPFTGDGDPFRGVVKSHSIKSVHNGKGAAN